MFNLDTHILIFALGGELRPQEQSLLARNRWSVSSIVLWELAKLIQLGRLDMDLDDREVVRILSRLHVWPIDLAVARASTRLDFSSDPADEIIAATSVVHNIPLLTRDTSCEARRLSPWSSRQYGWESLGKDSTVVLVLADAVKSAIERLPLRR